MTPTSDIVVVDAGPFLARSSSRRAEAQAIRRACRDCGFFYVRGHGVSEELLARLDAQSRAFFALPLEQKLAIRMARGGRAWRGYFPVGGELTSGKPDQKEGLYFGAELADDHPKVAARTPLHGRNLFPNEIPGFRETVLEYIDAATRIGHALMEGLALSLGLDESYFHERYTHDPLVLFRIFSYPPHVVGPDESWGVGEHTDYGLLTILLQDAVGGLQVKSPRGWIDAPHLPGTFICNIGDMLDRMTSGVYRSTPHRVRNPTGRARLSWPFFFDPGFDARVGPIDPDAAVVDDKGERWDRASVHEFHGTYGDYVLAKVSKVFPELRRTTDEAP
ncbi:MAG TPA: 2-oxoglutarate and iron-dependent oxygenase domain-containing protein [Vicinamibacterales bacterium]